MGGASLGNAPPLFFAVYNMTVTDQRPTKSAKELEREAAFERAVSAARRKVAASITRYRRLIDNLQGDLQSHGDPERWKRFGDLLLANDGTAIRQRGRVMLTDLFDEAAPTIEIEGDENASLSEIAEDYFRRYRKARNGRRIINERIAVTDASLTSAEAMLARIDAAIADDDVEFLATIAEPPKKSVPVGRRKKQEDSFKGVRRFSSTDGFEILVGKKAVDNDHLTFRIARSLDIWMHAADYPGSHVVIRNPNRKEIPNRTLIEAAQLAAFYSSGNKQTKAAVNYTQKKFVNKPRKAPPGLVSLSSFKTLLVEPKVGEVTRS
jgi:predicted ribosome quality control (RQC) complex YloA/Tae2 family protein